MKGDKKMSTSNESKNEVTSYKEPDYKELYFTVMGKLTDICETIIEVQRDMEERYLKQTDDIEKI